MKLAKYIVVLFSLCLSVVNVSAEGNDFDLRFVSSYVWRGMLLSDDASFQPSMSLTKGDFGFNFWTTLDMSDAPNSPDRERVDLTVDYTKRAGSSIFTAGVVSYIYYDAPSGGAQDTFEVSLDYALDLPDIAIIPSFTVNYDVGEVEGYYATLGLSQAIPLDSRIWDMDIQVFLSGGDEKYNNYYFNPGSLLAEDLDASLIDLEIRVSFPYMGQEDCMVVPEVRYMRLMDSALRDAAAAMDRDDDEFVYSLSFQVLF